MIKKIFANSHAIWNWIVVSSADPTQVALTVKGLIVGIPAIALQILPLLGFHPGFDLNSLGDGAYSVVLTFFTLVGGGMAFFGAVRKFYLLLVTPAV